MNFSIEFEAIEGQYKDVCCLSAKGVKCELFLPDELLKDNAKGKAEELLETLNDIAQNISFVKPDSDSEETEEEEKKEPAIEWYGVEIDESNTDPAGAVTRTGNMDLHRQLPVQNGMRRCLLLDDGTVNYYLDANDSTLKEDGTTANLWGEDGQVMVEIPDHYVCVERNGDKVSVRMSAVEGAIEGAAFVPKHYISAYQAVVKDDVLCSVSGDMATTDMTIGNFRAAAMRRGKFWSQYQYNDAVDLYWLFLVEYANRNSQAEFIPELDKDGFHQGGLGMGCTYIEDFNGDYPYASNRYTHILGNKTGESPIVGGVVNSYRGIENPFGNIYTFLDGIVNMKGEIYRAFNTELCVDFDDAKNPADYGYWLDAEYNKPIYGYSLCLNIGNSKLGSILIGEKGKQGIGYTDYSDVLAASLSCVCGGGCARGSADGAPLYGLACVNANDGAFGRAYAFIGSRLCFHKDGTTVVFPKNDNENAA